VASVNKNAVVFFPHNLWPPRTGAHQRCLQVLGGLQALGYEVTLTSSILSSESRWDRASVEALKGNGLRSVHVYETTAEDHDFFSHLSQFPSTRAAFSHPRHSFYLLRNLQKRGAPLGAILDSMTRNSTISSIQYTPPGMRRWFAKIVEESEPDLVIMNYAHWDGLIDHRKLKSTARIMDMLDLVSLNRRLQEGLVKFLPTPLTAELTPDHILEENFFEELGVSVAAEEFRIFNKYDQTIAITEKEADLIRLHTHRTKVSWLPVTLEPCYHSNNYSDSALFTVGPNPFNTQGYLYFVKKVLPLVLDKVSSFSLQVTGSFYDHGVPDPVPGVTIHGFVPDLKSVFQNSRFFVCPVFGGTGQQIKIVEAMAHGLPVVALRFAAGRSPLRHEVNGLIADNAEQFAEHTVRLWNDPALCRRLGDAARETVAGEFSSDRLIDALSRILEN
jgi:hypothetical protein